ncbi:NUDIX hydrolase [candidate division NPL-UPA2 bacterium]|nr:NUDIX hydrolase [candidate division NPL-UPA2 bacterium]
MAKISALKVRVAVILIEGEKILLVKHRKHQRSYWVLPGGTVEWGETLEETAKREMKEETNLEIALGELIFINEAIPGDGQRHIIDFYFAARIAGGDLKVTKEKVLREAKFFKMKELDNLLFYPDIKEELKEGWKKGFPGKPTYLGNRWKK